MQDSSLNHLPRMLSFASTRRIPFMEIDDKGGEMVQRYESFGRDCNEDMQALGEIETNK